MANWIASFEEQSILSGKLWYSDETFVMASGTDISVALDVSDIGSAIVSLSIQSDIIDGLLEVYEGGSYTGGTAGIAHRVNRNAGRFSTTTITENVVYTPVNAPIRLVPILGDRGLISLFDRSIGLIMKKNDITVFRITNSSAQEATALVTIVFGESDLF